jgi:dGTPase
LFAACYREMERRYPAAPEKLKFNEALKKLLDTLVTDLIDATRRRLRQQKIRSVDDVRRSRARLAQLSAPMARENRRLKEFLYSQLYSHRHVDAERRPTVRLIEEVFQYFMENPQSLPSFYLAKTREEPLHRVVCDYVAGMTDNYLRQQPRADRRSLTRR